MVPFANEPDRARGAVDPAEPVTEVVRAESLPSPEPDPGAAAPAPAPDVDYKDRWLRAEAELQNVRRRAQRELEHARRSAEESVALEIVAALDDLERALEAARVAGASEGWTQGVALTAQRMRDALARLGVTPIDPGGEPFDPALHEAILEVDAPEGVSPGTVVQVVDKGYRRGDRALRAARVMVARTSSRGDA